ncbi:hypothetical protein [Yersinia phage fHe-Yen9-04]|uniref:Uncharacterized protein n=1 Tax=Yersinia phage fHe-Yen9-04 TaxID=2052742 RepID=A0A2C9CY77_9CAUD|nr:hypothetical protein FDJ41_gp434 [Yersinia phage fHe-Yen9-04]SOK58746.1 hypothetical protein [Yersinia phage fHe-Yen9-04]VUE36515.1 hypothetical protein [Yersinia phage fHe-Yen9-04]
MNITLLIVSGMLMLAAIFVYLANKEIAAKLYENTYRKSEGLDTKSPYCVIREKQSQYSDDYVYYIGEGTQKVDNRRFFKLSELMPYLNELEKIKGYELTKF